MNQLNPKNKFILFILATCLFAACSQRPTGVLDDENMRSVLVDLHKVDGVFFQKGTLFQPDSIKEGCYIDVLKKHHITRAQFDSSLIWYTNNPEKFEKIYDLVCVDLANYKAEVFRGKYHPFDTILTRYAKMNLWTLPRCYKFQRNMPKTNIAFEFSDPKMSVGDIYILRFNQFISRSDSSINLHAVLKVNYQNGTSDSIFQKIKNDGKPRKYLFRLTAKRYLPIKSVSGKLLGSDGFRGKSIVKIDSISLVRLYDVGAQDSLNQKVEKLAPSSFFSRFKKKKS